MKNQCLASPDMGIAQRQLAGFGRDRTHSLNRSLHPALLRDYVARFASPGAFLGINPIYSAAMASGWVGKRFAYLVMPTMVKTLLKCAERPKAETFWPALAASMSS